MTLHMRNGCGLTYVVCLRKVVRTAWMLNPREFFPLAVAEKQIHQRSATLYMCMSSPNPSHRNVRNLTALALNLQVAQWSCYCMWSVGLAIVVVGFLSVQ